MKLSAGEITAKLDLLGGADEKQLVAWLAGFQLLNGERGLANLKLIDGWLQDRTLLGALLSDALAAADPDAALNLLERLCEVVEKSELRLVLADDEARRQLLTVLGGSPFLAGILCRNQSYFTQLFPQRGITREVPLPGMLAELRKLIPEQSDFAQLKAGLRRYKAEQILRIGSRDLCGLATLEQVTAELSSLAAACLQRAYEVCSVQLREEYGAPLEESAQGARPAEFTILGMGKFGGNELNFSSDIDLIYCYSSTQGETGGGSRGEKISLHRYFVKLSELLTRAMSQVTEDGFVFRVDTRLRPDGNSGDLAISLSAAESYYESWGQSWERAAMIKARPVAGSIRLGEELLRRLKPFVFRRYLDYGMIEDMKLMKQKINASLGREQEGARNLKLGRGGIREIEFFVQTQQLILGGRRPELRDNTTLGAMLALRNGGVVEKQTAADLTEAYRQLRNVEHRIQMRNDEQTHTVPKDPDARAAVAGLCGYDNLADFDHDLLDTRRRVQAAYDTLFEAEDRATGEGRLGNLVFTGVDDDPGTVETLRGLGFSNPGAAIATIRNWHRGRVPATRTGRGRELLTAILPRLLEDMGRTGEADEAFRWFSRFFDGLSSGVQTLAMLLAEPDLLDDLVATLALAPRLAEILSRRPDLLEALVSGQAPVRPQIGPDTPFDTALDAWRRYHRDRNFLTGHRLLHGLIPAGDAAEHWTLLADETIREMANVAMWETERRNGPQPGRWSVVAMGKLGGAELTAGSDLDIIVIYDADPMEAQTWYTRFTQRLITALTAPTAEGALYEVDMRLRPSGRAGPVAVSLPAFDSYQNKDAWTWEHMALTRLRPVAGDVNLGETVHQIAIDAITHRARTNAEKIPTDIRDMRQRLYREKPGKGLWDLKTAAGGLIDVEFIVQQDMLLGGDPLAIFPNTLEAIAGSGFGIEERIILTEGARLLQALQQIQRLAIGEETRSDNMPAALRDRLCRAVEAENFPSLESELSSVKSRLHEMAVKKLHLDATEI